MERALAREPVVKTTITRRNRVRSTRAAPEKLRYDRNFLLIFESDTECRARPVGLPVISNSITETNKQKQSESRMPHWYVAPSQESRDRWESLPKTEGETGKDYRFGEVDVQAERERPNVIEDGNDILLTTRKKERTYQHPGVNLYVRNLDGTIDDKRLNNEFSVFGPIISAKVMVNGGLPSGYGFVNFQRAEDASMAIEKMNGAVVAGKPMYVTVHQNKEERYAHLAEKYNMPPSKAQWNLSKPDTMATINN